MMPEKKQVQGLLLHNKPPGITSFEALGEIKRSLGTKKVGHTGTLDSFASGLLVVLAGPLTHLVSHITALDKTYRATVRFGAETDTLDPTGRVVKEAPPPTEEKLRAMLPRFTGRLMQIPPVYSAIHLNGKRASDRARSGETPEMTAREVEIFSLELREFRCVSGRPEAVLEVHCSKGTYIRSLARDIGKECGSAAHLGELVRSGVGPFRLEEAAGELWPMSAALAARCGLGAVKLKDEVSAQAFQNGKKLPPPSFGADWSGSAAGTDSSAVNPCSWAVFSPADDFLGVVSREKGVWRYGFVAARN